VESTLPHLVIELVEYVVEPDHLLELVISIVRILDLLVPLIALGQHQLDVFFPDVKNVKKLLSALWLFLKIAFQPLIPRFALPALAAVSIGGVEGVTVPRRHYEDGSR
jgi:hypothetical protein